MKYTDLEKQLIILSMNRISIEHYDGHRWITADEEFDEALRVNGIQINNKIYGGVKEAVQVIDIAWQAMHEKTLIQDFDHIINPDYDIEHIDNPKGRIDHVRIGYGGLR